MTKIWIDFIAQLAKLNKKHGEVIIVYKESCNNVN